MKTFVQDQRGNFAVITGILSVLLIGSLGGILDLSTQWIDQSVVQRAVDAAALAGAKKLEIGTEAEAQKVIQLAAKANLPVGFPDVTFQGKIDQTAGTVDVVGSGNLAPNFLQLFQIRNLPIDASSQALIQRKSFVDFYFLLDISESMNIAASDEDRSKLEKATNQMNGRPCAFACHVPDWDRTLSNYAISQIAGVTLRVDVLRSAADSMIDKVLSLNSAVGSLVSTRVATAGFSSSFHDWQPPITHAGILKASIRTPAPEPHPHSDMKLAFEDFRRKLGAQGSGRTQSDPKKIAIVVTDGVRDEDESFSPFSLGPVDPLSCKPIKDGGIDLVVLEIKYIKNFDTGNFFRDRVARYYDLISPNMKSCASPNYYYQAQDAGSAESQLLQIVDDIMTVRRRLSS
ncbi:TadE/TadG family type IV pilus assembly protein [Aureimonas sp. AU20]|uniref:TadE/TadG family type IV pilus assembly protein n=1 Tax=Aureimonas sp. AU20 TaxID=1349819 RepID=UPI0007220B66|nr:pilus assembly protein TadG-related protein [Aureimonas sp. AU20]ALN75302.1 hypothetical protein M673_21440 [Aureimonas sp. AU20]